MFTAFRLNLIITENRFELELSQNLISKVKSKAVPLHAMEALGGEEV
jgi:hypothetical protein